MHFIEYLKFKTLKYDLTNKFFYKNTKEIPKVKKIILNFSCKTDDIKQLSASMLFLEIITSKKGKLTISKKSNIILKIKKGNPTGCKIILQKKQLFNFLEKIFIFIFPNLKSFSGIKLNKNFNSKALTFKLLNIFNYNEFKDHYYLFNNLQNLNFIILTTSKSKKELIFILKSIQFPIKLKQI